MVSPGCGNRTSIRCCAVISGMFAGGSATCSSIRGSASRRLPRRSRIHYDHVGGLHEFDTRLMHEAEAPMMSPYQDFSALVSAEFGPFLDLLIEAGYVIEDDILIDALPHADYDPTAFATVSATPTRTLKEADGIDLGNRHFEVLHLPGHSPGSIGLWEASSGMLFSGDAIYDGLLLDLLPDSDIEDYMRTMKRLRELPVDVVHAGHEPSFSRERLIELADAYLVAKNI